MTTPLAPILHEALQQVFAPSQLEVIDESYQHAGHAEAGAAINSHFRVRISAESLAGKRRVAQHQAIYAALEVWMNNPIHALAIEIM